jgi:hypothetical protein
MNKYLCLACLLFCGCNIFAQEADVDSSDFEGFETPRILYTQNIVKANIIPFLIGQIPYCGEARITYERMLTHNQSLVIGASYNYPNIFLLMADLRSGSRSFSQFSLRGGRGMIGYRYYPIKSLTAPNGLFIGPFFSYNFVKIKEKNGNGSYQLVNYMNATFTVGYQVAFTKHFYGEIITGIGYRKNFYINYNASTNTKSVTDYQFPIKALNHVKFLMMINLAYAF